MLTQLLETLLVSSVGTMIVVVLYVVRTRYRKRVKVYGPFTYKLDDSGALKEMSADSVPIGVVEILRQRTLGEVRFPKSMLKKPPLVLFALVIFVIQLIILCLI